MAGRQIKPSKGANDLYDAGRGHVYAEKIQPLPDNLKKKISVILEAIPSKSKSEIAEVLQACDYDVDRALNCFYADGGMEGQNEWMVQGKRKNNKKRKPGKKAAKDGSDSQSQNNAENCSVAGPKTEKQAEAGQKEVGENITNGTVPKGHHPVDKPTTTNKDSPKSLENLKPVSNDVPKPSETTPTPTSPPPPSPMSPPPPSPMSPPPPSPTSPPPPSPMSPPPPSPMSPPPPSPLLSPTDSMSSLQDSQTSNKSRAGASSANEKHPRARTTSGSEVIKRSLKDLERSSVSISRYQSKLDEQAELSTKTLAKSFQAIRQALDERERYLQEQQQSVIEEAKKLLEERQENAAGLKFKCKRVGSMSDEETTELRNEIKHFVGERRIDEDLGKTIRFIRDEEKILEAVKNFGEVPPIKHHYTPYKRKHPEPSKPISHKPPPVKTTTASSNVSTTTPTTSTSSETKSTNSKNDKRPVLSPSRLKDQAEIHARLQQAVKEQQVSPVSKEGNKQSDRTASEKPKPRDFGPKSNRNNNGKDQQGNSRREPQRQRQTSSSQNSTKSFRNRNENKLTNGKNSKTQVKADGAKAQGGSPADGVSQAQDGSQADNGTQAQDGNSADNSTQAQKDKPAESNHVSPNQGNRWPKRRYIRKTPPGEGSPIFRTGTVDTNNPSSAKENGDHNEAKSSDLPNGQLESQMTNGTNGFVPLPQRNRRQRKVYYKKDPGSKVEFPPARENGSVPA